MRNQEFERKKIKGEFKIDARADFEFFVPACTPKKGFWLYMFMTQNFVK